MFQNETRSFERSRERARMQQTRARTSRRRRIGDILSVADIRRQDINFMPTSHMDRSNITLIRPLIYIEEKYLSGLARRYELPIIHNPCPHDKHTSSEEIKNQINTLTYAD